MSVLGHSFAYSGGKPIGCGVDGGIECRAKGKDCLSRCQRDCWVVISGEVNEAGDGSAVTCQGVLLVVSDKGEGEGGRCWRWRDFHKCETISLVWGRGDA